jgi:hypothetical protein
MCFAKNRMLLHSQIANTSGEKKYAESDTAFFLNRLFNNGYVSRTNISIHKQERKKENVSIFVRPFTKQILVLLLGGMG